MESKKFEVVDISPLSEDELEDIVGGADSGVITVTSGPPT
jgi:hypothetical protein